jgi:uncharacterized protein YqjF (DUF2071 family)
VSAVLDLLGATPRQRSALEATAHRPWPMPHEPWRMGQTWDDLLFAHWRVPAELLREHVAPQLELDTYDGEAWLGISPFAVTGLRARNLPPVPLVSSFLELNVRTYVTHRGERPGIWFFSLDASSRLAVAAARRLYHLPYFHARMQPPPAYRCARLGSTQPHVWEGAYEPAGAPFNAVPGTLEHFLTERYCLYARDRTGAIRRAEIHHRPWALQPARAEIVRNTMPPDGLEVGNEPEHLLFSRRQDVLIWPLR